MRNEFARQLRMGTSSTLAYVMLDATNPFFTDVAQGIELAAEKANVSLFICNSNNSGTREESHLGHLMQQRVQGILLTPVDPEADTIDLVAERGVPLVIVGRPPAILLARRRRRALWRRAARLVVDRALPAWPTSAGPTARRPPCVLPAQDLVVLPTASLSVAQAGMPRNGHAALPAATTSALGCCTGDRLRPLGSRRPRDRRYDDTRSSPPPPWSRSLGRSEPHKRLGRPGCSSPRRPGSHLLRQGSCSSLTADRRGSTLR